MYFRKMLKRLSVAGCAFTSGRSCGSVSQSVVHGDRFRNRSFMGIDDGLAMQIAVILLLKG